MENFDSILQIPIRSISDSVEIYSDELPEDVNDLLDVLKAEFAPLGIWRSAAVEYFRHGSNSDFFKVLNEIVDAMKVSDVEQFYEDKVGYHEGLIDIYNALACYALQNSQDSESNISLDDAVAYINKANSVGGRNDFALVLNGFVEIAREKYDLAEQRFKSAMSHMTLSQDKYLIYGALIGLASSAYAKCHFSKSLEYFVKALSSYPQCGSSIRVAIALCYFQLEQFDRARAAAKRALHMNADSTEALVLLGMLELIEANKNKQCSKALRRVAFEYFLLAQNVDASVCPNLNQLAHHCFYTWKHHNGTTSVVGANELRIIGEIDIASQDMIRIDKSHLATVDSVRVDGNGVLITVMSLNFQDKISKLVTMEYKQLSKVKAYAGNALHNTLCTQTKAESCFILGRLYHMLEQYDYALHFYEQSRQLSPALLLSSMYMGQILIAQHDFIKARDIFVELSRDAPEDRDAQAYLILSKSLVDRESCPVERIKDVSSGFNFDIDLWLLQGNIKQQSNCDVHGALKCYDMAIEIMKERSISVPTEVLSNMTYLHHRLGHLDEAKRFAIATLERDKKSFHSVHDTLLRSAHLWCPENSIFWDWSDVICNVEVIANPPSCGLQAVLRYPDTAILNDLHAGDCICVGDVVMHVQSILSPNQFSATALLPMPSGLFPLKRRTTWCGLFDVAPTHCYNYARILEDMGREDAAEELFFELIKRHPSFIECYVRLSRISMREHRLDRASMWLSRAAGIDANSCAVQKLSYEIDCVAERCEQAKKSMDKILRKDKNDLVTLLSLGNVHYDTANTSSDNCVDLCSKYWHRVLDENKTNFAAVNNIGIICGEKFQMDASREIFFKVREFVPAEYVELGINLANVYLIQGKFLDACRTYFSALSSIPTLRRFTGLDSMILMAAISESLSYSYFKSHQFDDCLRILAKTLHANPTRMSTWYNVAFTREEFALTSLRKSDKSSKDISGAIFDLSQAILYFEYLQGANNTSYDLKKASQHSTFCKDVLLKAEIHLSKANAEECKAAHTQRQHDEVHQLRIQEKARLKLVELESKEASRKELLEKAQRRAAAMENLQHNWSVKSSNDDKTSKKKRKARNENAAEEFNEHLPDLPVGSIFDSDSESDMPAYFSADTYSEDESSSSERKRSMKIRKVIDDEDS